VESGLFFRAAGPELHVASTYGLMPWRLARAQFPLSAGICGRVGTHRQSAIVNDVWKDPRFNGISTVSFSSRLFPFTPRRSYSKAACWG